MMNAMGFGLATGKGSKGSKGKKGASSLEEDMMDEVMMSMMMGAMGLDLGPPSKAGGKKGNKQRQDSYDLDEMEAMLGSGQQEQLLESLVREMRETMGDEEISDEDLLDLIEDEMEGIGVDVSRQKLSNILKKVKGGEAE